MDIMNDAVVIWSCQGHHTVTARNAGLHWSWSLTTKQPRPESGGL